MEGPPDKPESGGGGGGEDEGVNLSWKERATLAEAEASAPPAEPDPSGPPPELPKPPSETPEDKRRKLARGWALATFLVVLPLALGLVLSPVWNHWRELDDGPFERRSETTVVTKVTAGSSPSKKVTVTQGPGTSPAGPSKGKPGKTTANETTTTGKTTETTTTVGPAKDSLFVTALGNSGLLLVRIGIALLTAWVAAAAVQRAILGRFGVKVGPIDIAELPDIVIGLDGVKQLVDKLTVQVAELEKTIKPNLPENERIELEANLAQFRAESEAPRQQVQLAIDRLRDRSGPVRVPRTTRDWAKLGRDIETGSMHSFRGADSVLLSLQVVSISDQRFTCTVKTPSDGSYTARARRRPTVEYTPVNTYETLYPDKFREAGPLIPGRYEVEWHSSPIGGREMPSPIGSDSFTIPESAVLQASSAETT